MSNTVDFKQGIVRWRVAGIAIVLGATLSVGAGAQQTAPASAGQRTSPCPIPQANGATSASGVTSATSNGAVSSDSAGTARAAATPTASSATNGTPTGSGSTAGVAAQPTPNNASTNPDQRFTGLNATNGGAGVGADTTTTGKRVPPVAEQVPSDSVRTGATVCAPTTSGRN